MFLYESVDSLNLTLVGNEPVTNPDLIIKGYKDGASVIVGESVYGLASGEAFTEKAKTFVYQKDNKLAITFRGVAGMADPEVTIDEVAADKFDVVVSGEAITLTIADGKVSVETKSEDTTEPEEGTDEEPVEEEVIPAEEPETDTEEE